MPDGVSVNNHTFLSFLTVKCWNLIKYDEKFRGWYFSFFHMHMMSPLQLSVRSNWTEYDSLRYITHYMATHIVTSQLNTFHNFVFCILTIENIWSFTLTPSDIFLLWINYQPFIWNLAKHGMEIKKHVIKVYSATHLHILMLITNNWKLALSALCTDKARLCIRWAGTNF